MSKASRHIRHAEKGPSWTCSLHFIVMLNLVCHLLTFGRTETFHANEYSYHSYSYVSTTHVLVCVSKCTETISEVMILMLPTCRKPRARVQGLKAEREGNDGAGASDVEYASANVSRRL